jgi:Fe-S-cluster containining protein
LSVKPLGFKYPKHIRFGCERCGLCCGDTEKKVRSVLLLRIEAEHISQKTSLSLYEFVENIEDSEPYVYRLKKNADGKCMFLKDNGCTIYQMRPLICRFYPFELRSNNCNEYVFAFTEECPSIGKGVGLEKDYFERLFKNAMRLMRENSETTSKAHEKIGFESSRRGKRNSSKIGRAHV